ncbi:acyl carrier protein [Campylobacter sp.]|uniref:acyl carrier protein n=1 Tax=Campylobacter sp. TaxID=205 RepID=UPI00360F7EFD
MNEKMALIAELLELEVSDFNPETKLEELEEWDSLAAISYVVMMDEHFGVTANPNDIRNFKTIQDILDSMK